MKKNMNLKKLTIAHRGVHNNKDIPENSLLAFKKAIELGYPIEFDIQLSKDNKLIIFHDNSLERLTNSKKRINELTLSEIKKLTLLNTNETIPTLKEALSLIDGKVLIDIEIKSTKSIKKICKLLLNELKSYKGDIIIKSFNPIIVRYMKKIQNNYNCGLLLKNKYSNKFLNYLMKTHFFIRYSKPDFLAIEKSMINNENLKEYFSKLPVLLWTIKKEEELKKYNINTYSLVCNNLPYKKI